MQTGGEVFLDSDAFSDFTIELTARRYPRVARPRLARRP